MTSLPSPSRVPQGPLGSARHASDGPARVAAPVGGIAFLGVCVISFGGPLALAALYAPTAVADVASSAGAISLAAAAAFAIPLAIWLGYSRRVASSGGLYSFVREAAGARVAAVQAVLWIASYTLYLIYTTASIVYDVLPAVLPGVRPWRPLLEIAIPVVLAAIMLAGRTATLAVCGALAVGQLALVGALAAVTIGHDAPAGSFAPTPLATEPGIAAGQVALLYVCGSLPLFLGGEVTRPARTVRSGLVGGYLLTAAGVTAVLFPLAANPAFAHAAIPGVSMAEVFAGHGLAVAVGIGVAASIAGVMLVEYLALSRLLATLARRSVRQVVTVLAVVLVVSAPITLLNAEGIYAALVKPSLVALWLSQLVVCAVYPRFAVAGGRSRIASYALATGGVLFMLGGLYASLQQSST